MTVAPKPRLHGLSGPIDGWALTRRAARALGWVGTSPEASRDGAFEGGRPPGAWTTAGLGLATLRRSPLARRIVAFNLVALVLLAVGMVWLMPSREALALRRADGLASEALLVAAVVEARLPASGLLDGAALARLDLREGTEAFLFDRDGRLVFPADPDTRSEEASTAAFQGPAEEQPRDAARIGLEEAQAQARLALANGAAALADLDDQGRGAAATALVRHDGRAVGALVLRSAAEAWSPVGQGRAQVLPLLALAAAVSVGLSLVLASTIANPMAALVAAAEAGQSRDARSLSPGRVRIPDLSDRADEIGRLSGALRGMVAALYDRIDLNEQFAADVAHEIKNPLASLRSAVGTLRVARREDQRETLLGIIEHDVRRLDRLVSDISSASRLDSDLVKEEEASFDLIALLSGLTEHLAREAGGRGIDLVTDLPHEPILVRGLEARLAQVVVNVVGNAISLCEDGDAVRVWVRKREARVLVVVEDTGPGIPEEALAKIFQRFYSQRPEGQFGNNSGLGLAISKQIVEAHGGVIWAENIHPTELDPTSEPMGARFVVGLPV